MLSIAHVGDGIDVLLLSNLGGGAMRKGCDKECSINGLMTLGEGPSFDLCRSFDEENMQLFQNPKSILQFDYLQQPMDAYEVFISLCKQLAMPLPIIGRMPYSKQRDYGSVKATATHPLFVTHFGIHPGWLSTMSSAAPFTPPAADSSDDDLGQDVICSDDDLGQDDLGEDINMHEDNDTDTINSYLERLGDSHLDPYERWFKYNNWI